MNIFEKGVEKGKELGIERGIEQGMEQGNMKTLIRSIELNMKNFHINLEQACEGLEISVEDYENAKRQIARWEKENKK